MKILVSGPGSFGHRHFRNLIALGESEYALHNYRELGFEMVNHYIAYHKELK